MPANDMTTGLILTPDGQAASKPTIILSAEQARIMREYKKKVLGPLGLKEALYCDSCWEHDLSHGCNANVTDNQIAIVCRCQIRFFQGPTY